MYAQGVSATSVDDVLDASGTGKSQLYHYFDDRADLVAAVIDHQIDAILKAQPLLATIESLPTLERWARGVLAVHAQPGGPFACPLGSMAAELKNDPAYRGALQEAFRRWEEPVAVGLKTMVRNGELGRRDHPRRMAASIIGALQGGMLLARIADDVTPLRDTVAMVCDDVRRRVERQAAQTKSSTKGSRRTAGR